jgi:hypothetical protein
MVQVQGGEEVYFRFYDPRVLREFLPTAIANEVTIFFGPVQEWLIESDRPDTMLILQQNRGILAIAHIAISDPDAGGSDRRQ